MSADVYPLLIPTQYTLLDTFSPDTPENINNILKMLIPNIASITETVGGGNGVLHEESYFNITHSGGSQAIVTPGLCIIKETLIEIIASKYLNVDQLDSYIYGISGDTVPTIDGNYTLVICLEYTPSDVDPNAYIGLINNVGYYNGYINDLIVLGLLYINKTGAVYTITNVDYYDSILDIGRSYPVDMIDGGVLNDPIS